MIGDLELWIVDAVEVPQNLDEVGLSLHQMFCCNLDRAPERGPDASCSRPAVA